MFPIVDSSAYGALADGEDRTNEILSASSNGAKIILIQPGVKFNQQVLLSGLPADVVCLDFSLINDYSELTETTKKISILSKDSAENDTHLSVDSDHHAILSLNNHGGAGTQSAAERKGSILWACGQKALNSNPKKNGWRGGGIFGFTKETGSDFWKWVIRSLAPFVSIGGKYEDWESGQTIASSGVFRVGSNSYHYVSANAGTTASPEPTHTSGTVADGGGVLWTYIDASDRSLISIDEYGRILVGSGTGMDTFRHKAGLTDVSGNFIWWKSGESVGVGAVRRWGDNLYTSTQAMTTGDSAPIHTSGTVSSWAWTASGSAYIMDLAARGVSKDVLIKMNPTNSVGSEVLTPYIRAIASSGFCVMKSDGSSSLARFTDNGGMDVAGLCPRGATAPDGDATPSVNGVGTLYLSNSSATFITNFDDPSDNQEITVIFLNGNTTIIHQNTLLLKGAANITPGIWSSMKFKRITNSISARWIEI